MTGAAFAPQPGKLGAGRIIGGTFSVFIRKFGYMLLFGLLPALLTSLFMELSRREAVHGVSASPLEFVLWHVLRPWMLWIVGAAIVMTAAINLVRATSSGNPVRTNIIARATIRSAAPVTLSLCVMAVSAYFIVTAIVTPVMISGILAGPEAEVLALIALTVALFFILAFFSIVPAIVVLEKRWFGFRRSMLLTRHFRWSCLGVMLTICVAAYLIAGVPDLLFLFSHMAGSKLSRLVIFAVSLFILPALFGISSALIYIRLREIKEGETANIFR